MPSVDRYVMAMCSPQTRSAFDAHGRFQREIFDANVGLYCECIARADGEHGARLIAFPQFGLTGYAPLGGSAWMDASVTFPGTELDRIAEAARAAQAYVIVQTSERHTAFPGRNFLSAAIFTPAGELGLVYRKNYAMSLRTSPIDVHDRFIETFGANAFFPVLETPLGTIGLLIGAEVHWPEPVRALALKGAEIIINPVATAPWIDYLNRPGAAGVRSVRAFENTAYLAMANIAQDDAPRSQIFDFDGGAIARAADETRLFTLADIDIEALRTARCAPAANFLAQIQPSSHEALAEVPLWPANGFADAPPTSTDELVAVQQAVWRNLQRLGRARAPA